MQKQYNNLEKRIKNIERRCCCSSGSIDGGCCYNEVTYAEADALIAADELIKGSVYKITDRGDRGIILTALSPNQFSIDGQRIMLCPNPQEGFGRSGFWYLANVYNIGDKVLWNAHVYENTTGANTGEPPGADWALIPKNSFTADEYTEFVFGVHYDFSEDWISKQWDDYGNIFGVTKQVSTFTYAGVNPVDISDWAFVLEEYSSSQTVAFHNNICDGLGNNRASSAAADGYLIKDNHIVFGGIFNNVVDNLSSLTIINNNMGGGGLGITNNGTESFPIAYITGNHIPGTVYGTTVSGAFGISDNINNGSIVGGPYGADVTDPIVDK